MKRMIILLVAACLLPVSCATTQADRQSQSGNAEILGDDVSVTIYVRDIAIENPDNDRRSYYKVYIDKVEAGRTGIALESQVKEFKTRVERNSHLLRLEKYVLDPDKERYVKVNNIEQPKPDYCYIDSTGASSQVIRITHDVQSNRATYQVRNR